jgi:hypothetical protein
MVQRPGLLQGDAFPLVPDPHLPKALRMGTEFLALVTNVDGLVRNHLAALPQIRLTRLEGGGTACHHHLPGGLDFIPLAGFQNPAQPRLPDVNALRVGQLLTAQATHRQPTGWRRHRHQPKHRCRRASHKPWIQHGAHTGDFGTRDRIT